MTRLWVRGPVPAGRSDNDFAQELMVVMDREAASQNRVVVGDVTISEVSDSFMGRMLELEADTAVR